MTTVFSGYRMTWCNCYWLFQMDVLYQNSSLSERYNRTEVLGIQWVLWKCHHYGILGFIHFAIYVSWILKSERLTKLISVWNFICRPGSIKYDYIMIFNPEPPSPLPPTVFPNTTEEPGDNNHTAEPTSPPLSFKLSTTFVMQVLKTAISSGKMKEVSPMLNIDETSVVAMEGTLFYISWECSLHFYRRSARLRQTETGL